MYLLSYLISLLYSSLVSRLSSLGWATAATTAATATEEFFSEHPSPILHAPRDIISRKGKSLTPIKKLSYVLNNSSHFIKRHI